MIFTLTCNPAVDKMTTIDQIQLHSINRLMSVESDAGGKGINVSRTVQCLGMPTTAFGFLGGTGGHFIHHLLERENIQHEMVEIIGNTRSNLKIFDHLGVTEFNEEGPFVLQSEVDELLDLLREKLDATSILVISGSLPKGVSQSFYKTVIEIARENQCFVCIDTHLWCLREALNAYPEIVKINSKELASYNHIDAQLSEEEIITKGRNLLVNETGMLIVPKEHVGTYVITKNHAYLCEEAELPMLSKVGCSDSFIAGVAVGIKKGYSDEKILELASACYIAASQTKNSHPRTIQEIEKCYEYVKIRKVQ